MDGWLNGWMDGWLVGWLVLRNDASLQLVRPAVPYTTRRGTLGRQQMRVCLGTYRPRMMMCLVHVQSFSRSSSLAPPASHPLAVTPTHHTPQIPNNTDVDCFVTVGGGALNAFSKCQLAGEATTDPLPVRRCGCLPLHCVEKSANQREISESFSTSHSIQISLSDVDSSTGTGRLHGRGFQCPRTAGCPAGQGGGGYLA